MDIGNLSSLLETARTGTLRGAAARLRVDETTVSRRIARLEKELGVRLFDRGARSWSLTESGRALLPHAEAIDSEAARARESLSSSSGELSGTARVLTMDGFGAYLLIPGLAPLLRAHPRLELEILTGSSRGLVTARDFDLAVTLERPGPRSAIVSRLAYYDLKFYASHEYLRRHGCPQELRELREHHDLVWYIDSVLDVEPLRILETLVPRARARVQTNNIAGHHAAARAGLGIVPLPTYIGGEDPELTEVLGQSLHARRCYWLVVPHESARLWRVRETAEAITALVREHPRLQLADGCSTLGARRDRIEGDGD